MKHLFALCGGSDYISDAVMRLSGYRRTTSQLEDCFVFDSVAEIQPDEAVPLLKHSLRQNFEMAPVHMTDYHVPSSDTFRVNSGVHSSALDMNSKSSYFQTFNRGSYFLCHCVNVYFLDYLFSLVCSALACRL